EMHRAMLSGDFMVRSADYDIALIEYERGRAKKPTPPRKGDRFGLSKIYCALLDLPRPSAAQAQAPPAAHRLDSVAARRAAAMAAAAARGAMPGRFGGAAADDTVPHSPQEAA